MRKALFGLAGLMLFCGVASAQFVTPAPAPPTGPNPIEATRGTALRPPTPAVAPGQAAPPEGAGPGGINFGQWRGANPETYGPAFQTQMRTRFAGRTREAARTDLTANGFNCGVGANTMQCRIEIMERNCATDWYVVFESGRDEPVAGYDVMCLGAR